MNYKDLVERLRAIASSRNESCGKCQICTEAADAIKDLVEELDAVLAYFKPEAADCMSCKWYPEYNDGKDCNGNCTDMNGNENWEWRWPQ